MVRSQERGVARHPDMVLLGNIPGRSVLTSAKPQARRLGHGCSMSRAVRGVKTAGGLKQGSVDERCGPRLSSPRTCCFADKADACDPFSRQNEVVAGGHCWVVFNETHGSCKMIDCFLSQLHEQSQSSKTSLEASASLSVLALDLLARLAPV